MAKWGYLFAMLFLLCLPNAHAGAAETRDNLPRLPGSVLLVSLPKDNLAVTSGSATFQIKGGGEWYVMPSISADGNLIASASSIPGDTAGRPKLIVGTFAISENQWVQHKDLEIYYGAVAITPDGSKLACLTGNSAGAPGQLTILDLKSGKITRGPKASDGAGPEISWSPDGRRIAFEKAFSDYHSEILVLDIETGQVSKIASGRSPSWSPSGEWIMYYDQSPRLASGEGGGHATNANRICLTHPDGKDSRVLVTFHTDDDVSFPAVWSPDSRTVLIDRPQDDAVNPRMDIYTLEVATGTFTRKFKKTSCVYGWVRAR
jgi:dipeptidyl aminopeptidase/acylaminoacyl peptidase